MARLLEVQVDQHQVDNHTDEVDNLEDVLFGEPFHLRIDGLDQLNKKNQKGRSCGQNLSQT